MKTLITYYSRTGITKKVAKSIANLLKADVEEIISVADRKGKKGNLLCGREAISKIKPEIKKTKKDVSKYDLVIIGTPVWAFTMASPIRTYLENNKSKFKKTAFFATQANMGAGLTFNAIKKLIKKNPIAKLVLSTKEVTTNNFKEKVKSFVKKLK